MPTVNHPPKAVRHDGKTGSSERDSHGWKSGKITGRFLYAATSSLKRVTGRIFTISKCFHRSKPKLNLLISP
jgi:hypothetical protein